MRVVSAGAALAAVATACLGAEPYVPPPLAGRTFVAVEFVHDGELRPIWAIGGLTLHFYPDGRRFVGGTGCTEVYGAYQIVGGRLHTDAGVNDDGCAVGGSRPGRGYSRTQERWMIDVGAVLGDPLGRLYMGDPAVRHRRHVLEVSDAHSRLTLREVHDAAAVAGRSCAPYGRRWPTPGGRPVRAGTEDRFSFPVRRVGVAQGFVGAGSRAWASCGSGQGRRC